MAFPTVINLNERARIMDEYAILHFQQIQNLQSIYCKIFFTGFVSLSLLLIGYFIIKEYFYKEINCIDQLTRTFYITACLLVFYTLFLGSLFGRCSFESFYLSILTMPLYALYLKRYEPVNYMIFAMNVNNLIPILYAVFLLYSLAQCSISYTDNYANLIGLEGAKARVLTGKLNPGEVAIMMSDPDTSVTKNGGNITVATPPAIERGNSGSSSTAVIVPEQGVIVPEQRLVREGQGESLKWQEQTTAYNQHKKLSLLDRYLFSWIRSGQSHPSQVVFGQAALGNGGTTLDPEAILNTNLAKHQVSRIGFQTDVEVNGEKRLVHVECQSNVAVGNTSLIAAETALHTFQKQNAIGRVGISLARSYASNNLKQHLFTCGHLESCLLTDIKTGKFITSNHDVKIVGPVPTINHTLSVVRNSGFGSGSFPESPYTPTGGRYF